jgi:hypothetical protein
LATDEHTPLSETRPWIEHHVSVAQFKLLRDVQVLDCFPDHSEDYTFYFEEPADAQERERAVWRELSRSLSEPIGADDRDSEYVTTQLVAEHFRAHGVDDIMYQSVLGGGKNLALFDLKIAEATYCTLHYVSGIVPVYKKIVNPKFLHKHCPEREPDV